MSLRNAKLDTPVHVYMVSQNLQMLDVEEGLSRQHPQAWSWLDFSSCGFHASDAKISRRGICQLSPALKVCSAVCPISLSLVWWAALWWLAWFFDQSFGVKWCAVLRMGHCKKGCKRLMIQQLTMGCTNSNILYLLLDSSSFIDSTRLLVAVDIQYTYTGILYTWKRLMLTIADPQIYYATLYYNPLVQYASISNLITIEQKWQQAPESLLSIPVIATLVSRWWLQWEAWWPLCLHWLLSWILMIQCCISKVLLISSP